MQLHLSPLVSPEHLESMPCGWEPSVQLAELVLSSWLKA